MQIDLSTEYVKMADLLSVDPVGLQVKVQVISGTVLVTETMEQPQASSNFGFAFGKTQIFTSTGAGGDLYIRGTTQSSTIEVTVSAGDFNAGISPFNGAGGGATSNPIETPASIKQKYESNPNTNAFTDEAKEAVQELIDGGGSTGVSNVDVTYNSSSKVLAVAVDATAGSAVLTGVATESYTDGKKNEAVEEAKTYTDDKIAGISGVTDTYTKQEIDDKDQDILAQSKTYTDQHSGGGGGSFSVPNNELAMGKDGTLIGSGISVDQSGKIALPPNSLGIGHHTYSSAGERPLIRNESNNSLGSVLLQDDADGSVELIQYTSDSIEHKQGEAKTETLTNPEFTLNVVEFGRYKIDELDAEIELAAEPASNIILEFFDLGQLISKNIISPQNGLVTFKINSLYASGGSEIEVKITQENGEDIQLKGSDGLPYFKFSYRTYTSDYAVTETLLSDEVVKAKPRLLETSMNGQTLTTKLSFTESSDDLTATVVLPSSGGGSGNLPSLNDNVVPVFMGGTLIDNGITYDNGVLSVDGLKVNPIDSIAIGAITTLSSSADGLVLHTPDENKSYNFLMQNILTGKAELKKFGSTFSYASDVDGNGLFTNPDFILPKPDIEQGFYQIMPKSAGAINVSSIDFQADLKIEFFVDGVIAASVTVETPATNQKIVVTLPALSFDLESEVKVKMSASSGDVVMAGGDTAPYIQFNALPYDMEEIGSGDSVSTVDVSLDESSKELTVDVDGVKNAVVIPYITEEESLQYYIKEMNLSVTDHTLEVTLIRVDDSEIKQQVALPQQAPAGISGITHEIIDLTKLKTTIQTDEGVDIVSNEITLPSGGDGGGSVPALTDKTIPVYESGQLTDKGLMYDEGVLQADRLRLSAEAATLKLGRVNMEGNGANPIFYDDFGRPQIAVTEDYFTGKIKSRSYGSLSKIQAAETQDTDTPESDEKFELIPVDVGESFTHIQTVPSVDVSIIVNQASIGSKIYLDIYVETFVLLGAVPVLAATAVFDNVQLGENKANLPPVNYKLEDGLRLLGRFYSDDGNVVLAGDGTKPLLDIPMNPYYLKEIPDSILEVNAPFSKTVYMSDKATVLTKDNVENLMTYIAADFEDDSGGQTFWLNEPASSFDENSFAIYVAVDSRSFGTLRVSIGDNDNYFELILNKGFIKIHIVDGQWATYRQNANESQALNSEFADFSYYGWKFLPQGNYVIEDLQISNLDSGVNGKTCSMFVEVVGTHREQDLNRDRVMVMKHIYSIISDDLEINGRIYYRQSDDVEEFLNAPVLEMSTIDSHVSSVVNEIVEQNKLRTTIQLNDHSRIISEPMVLPSSGGGGDVPSLPDHTIPVFENGTLSDQGISYSNGRMHSDVVQTDKLSLSAQVDMQSAAEGIQLTNNVSREYHNLITQKVGQDGILRRDYQSAQVYQTTTDRSVEKQNPIFQLVNPSVSTTHWQIDPEYACSVYVSDIDAGAELSIVFRVDGTDVTEYKTKDVKTDGSATLFNLPSLSFKSDVEIVILIKADNGDVIVMGDNDRAHIEMQVFPYIISDVSGGGGSGDGDVKWTGSTSDNDGKIIIAASDDGKSISSGDLTVAELTETKALSLENKSSIEDVESSLSEILGDVSENTNRIGAAESSLNSVEIATSQNTQAISDVESSVSDANSDISDLQNTSEQTTIKLNNLIEASYDRPHLEDLSKLSLSAESFASVTTPQEGLEVFKSAIYASGITQWEITLTATDNFYNMLPEAGGVFVVSRFDDLLYSDYVAESGKRYVALISSDGTFHDWKDITATTPDGDPHYALQEQIDVLFNRVLPLTTAIEQLGIQSTIEDGMTRLELAEVFVRQSLARYGPTIASNNFILHVVVEQGNTFYGLLPSDKGGLLHFEAYRPYYLPDDIEPNSRDTGIFRFFAEDGYIYEASYQVDGDFVDWQSIKEIDDNMIALRIIQEQNNIELEQHSKDLSYLSIYNTKLLTELKYQNADLTSEILTAAADQEDKARIFHESILEDFTDTSWRFDYILQADDNFYGFFTEFKNGIVTVEQIKGDNGKTTTIRFEDQLWIVDPTDGFKHVSGGSGGTTPALETAVETNKEASEILFDISDYAIINSPTKLGVDPDTVASVSDSRQSVAALFADATYSETKNNVSYTSASYKLKFFVSDSFSGFAPEQSGVLTITKTPHGDGACVEFDFSSIDGTRYWAHYHGGTFVDWRYISGSTPVPALFNLYSGWHSNSSVTGDEILATDGLFTVQTNQENLYSTVSSPSRSGSDYLFTFIAYPKNAAENIPQVNYNSFPADWNPHETKIDGIDYIVLMPQYANTETSVSMTLVER